MKAVTLLALLVLAASLGYRAGYQQHAADLEDARVLAVIEGVGWDCDEDSAPAEPPPRSLPAAEQGRSGRGR